MYKEGDQENDIVINYLGRFVNKRLCQVCGLFVGMYSFTYLPGRYLVKYFPRVQYSEYR